MERKDDAGSMIVVLLAILFAFAVLANGTSTQGQTADTQPEQEQEQVIENDDIKLQEDQATQADDADQGQVVTESIMDGDTYLQQEEVIQEENIEEGAETVASDVEWQKWRNRLDYMDSYAGGSHKYASYYYVHMKYERGALDIQYDDYQEYCDAAVQLMSEAITLSTISEKTLTRYNKAVENIPEFEYGKLDSYDFANFQGFQDGITCESYYYAICDLYKSHNITRDAFLQYTERFTEVMKEDGITHDTMLQRIELSKEFLAEHGIDDISVPYFT